MVIQEGTETPVEVPLIKKPALLQPKKYIIVKNHVREISDSEENVSMEISKQEKRKKKNKSIETSKEEPSSASSSENENRQSALPNTIEKSDLQELVTIYRKCKAIINKIELKYGHLINLNEETLEESFNSKNRSKRKRDDSETEDCDCEINRKIVFDELGNQSVKMSSKLGHICIHKLRKKNFDKEQFADESQDNIQIEYEGEDELPHDLASLYYILRNLNLDKQYRNKVIGKVKQIRQEYINVLRFNRPSIVEQLKINPEAILDFKGTNLSTINGY